MLNNDFDLAESILPLKKREWMTEYGKLVMQKNQENENMSFQSLTIHRNLVQVYEQFNWVVWSISYFYFHNHEFKNSNFGLPPPNNDAWFEGFIWKDIYIRLIPLEQAHIVKKEIETLKHLTLELEECFALEEKYKDKFNIDTANSYHKIIIPPLISISEWGGYAIYGAPEIPILKSGSKSSDKWIQNLQSKEEIDFSDSMLQLMPLLSKLKPENLIPLNIEGLEGKYIITNTFKLYPSHYPETNSKWIIRIPNEINEEVSMYPFPSKGIINLEDLVNLFKTGSFEDKVDSERKDQSEIAKLRDNIREWNFTAFGCNMKILLYDENDGGSVLENDRAKALFMSRDDRVRKMANLKEDLPGINIYSNHLLEHNMIGEPESINGNVLIIVEQHLNMIRLPYSMLYNKPVLKPEIYIEQTIEKTKEILEATNDIQSDLALKELLLSKGLDLSAIWTLSALVKTKLTRQLWMSYLLANSIKRLLNKELFIKSTILGEFNIPGGLVQDKEGVVAPNYNECLKFVITKIVKKKFEDEPLLFKHLLIILFFYRLESLQFYTSLQFTAGTKDYLNGKFILDDIVHVGSENPIMFLRVAQNVLGIQFSTEFMRKLWVDKYQFLYSESPFDIVEETEETGPNMEVTVTSESPVDVRERMYFVLAKILSSKEYADEQANESSMKSKNSTPPESSLRTDQDYSNSENDEDDEENEEGDDEDEEEEADSVNSSVNFNIENSPPFKQAKLNRIDSFANLNSVYASRNSLASNYDTVLRASHANFNGNSNYIDSNDNETKLVYMSKKIYLNLPSSLYRLKLNVLELDSFEKSKLSVLTEQVEHADFLQDFSILRQTYSLPSLDQFNDLIIFLENAFKDVYTVKGTESVLLEIEIIHGILLYICNKFDDIVKLLEKAREMLFNLSYCPIEIISMLQIFTGILFEKENMAESEKEYLMSMIHYFLVVGDPRGRGCYSSSFLLGLSWKASLIAHYYKKNIDAELCEEILDSTIFNLTQAKEFVKDSRSISQHVKKGTGFQQFKNIFGAGPTKNKFSKPVRSSPGKSKIKEKGSKIDIDDIDIEMLNEYGNEPVDPFDDMKYLIHSQKFLFYHWNVYKEKIEDIEDYLKYGAGNQLDYFVWLLRWNPCMYMSGIKFSKTKIQDFTFSDGVNNMLSVRSGSSIASGGFQFSSSMSQSSITSNLSTPSGRERKNKNLHHGAYQHILNKDHFAISRSESKGVVYWWGTDTQGQLGSSNIANSKLNDMDDDLRRTYPRILIGLKDLIIKEVCCGNEHSLAVTNQGNIYAWGNNTYKQLGIGYNAPNFVSQPTRVYNVGSVNKISWGYEHSIALTEAGELYSWGHGEGGLLGHGELEDQAVPKMILEFKKKDLKVLRVACGGLHTLAIAGDDEFYAWGRGEGGQLGISKKQLEKLERLDCGISVPICIIQDVAIVDVAAGVAHSLALTESGRVYGWGNGNYGQLGLGFSGESFEPGTGDAESSVFEPTIIKDLNKVEIKRIYAGSTFSMFLSEDEELYAWGTNDLGQCGIDTAHEELKAFQKIKDKATQKLQTALDISTPRKLECFAMMKVKGVSWGENHAFASVNIDEKSKKMLYGWGMYNKGQLGLGEIKKRVNPRLVQTLYNTTILSDNVSWGSSNTLCIVGDSSDLYPDETTSDDSEEDPTVFKALANDYWSIMEYRNEENYDEEEMEEKINN